ncbi:MAG: thiamine phosphate synthase [Thermoanaerobaculaceae bacterium]|nr:thiamine phosphate synthase [Thermoanaerobaculaceae bacterium]
MIFYAITDKKLNKTGSLFAQIKKYVSLGVDWIQIREKGLSDKELLAVANKANKYAKKNNIKLLINNRSDIAYLSNLYGIHLSSDSIPVKQIRKKFNNLFIIKSCHSLKDVNKAEEEGADAVVLSPIFETPSKRDFLKPLGLSILKKVVNSSKIPVIALGGIDQKNIFEVAGCNVYGVSAIRFFNSIHQKEFKSIKKILKEGN